ncbi:MAG: glycoside hydrolase family 3 N-terminal domain-containing protein [Solirubrobacteraceae bacterium]
MNDGTMRLMLLVASALVAAASVVAIANAPAVAGSAPAQRTVRPLQPSAVSAPGAYMTAPPADTVTVTTPTTPVATAQSAAALPAAPLSRMVGQQLMVAMSGTTPDASLLARIQTGQVGGVIIYGRNITSPTQLTQAIATMQQTATGGGNPRLLIATDQEGGLVRRLWWAPPSQTAPQLAALGPTFIQHQAYEAGLALRAVGINMDLAPVADVAHSTSTFIWQQGRSYSTNPATVSADASQFNYGLAFADVAGTAKHFPGLGGVAQDTDTHPQSTTWNAAIDLLPFQNLIQQQIPAIMTSLATYTNLDPNHPAALSPTIVTGMLRVQYGFRGVVITDNLPGSTGLSAGSAAVEAEQAGDDIMLVSSSEQAGADAYTALTNAARSGQITTSQISAADSRIAVLKQHYAQP